jgi:MGT family glycosyltransferase
MRFTRPEAGTTAIPRRGAPRVLASFGTVFPAPPELLNALLDTAAHRDWQVVVTQDPPARPVPGNVRFVGYTPLSTVLPRCDAVLTLGGLGTVTAALNHGLPMVIAPVNADQPVNADRCEALGVGLRLCPSPTSSALAAAVDTVLANPSFAERARAERAELATLPGVDTAATLVETVARTHRPVEVSIR